MEKKVNSDRRSTNEMRVIDPMSSLDGYSNTAAPLSPFKDGKEKYKQLTEEEQKDMSRSIADIFMLEEQDRKGGEEVDMDDDVEEVVDVEDRDKRTERLKGALGLLAHLWWQDSMSINEAAEKLADGSRDRKLHFEVQRRSTTCSS